MTVREFAELLADVNPAKLDLGFGGDDSELYVETVTPYLRLLIDWIEVEEQSCPTDDIPF